MAGTKPNPGGACSGTEPTAGGCNPSGYGPGPQLPGNQPLGPGELSCSIATRIQSAIDRAQRLGAHRLGLRPYRVRLVWQERTTADYDWREVTSLELYPVEVLGLDNLDLELDPDGLTPAGRVRLRKVSPSQVDEETLRGNLRGIQWSQDTSEREFFYEIQQHARCPGDAEPRRYRLVLAAAPHYDAENFQWRISLRDQRQARGQGGADLSVPQEIDAPRILT
ncbi:MAG: hypothetical protein M0R28_17840 [Pigmentiphaga sp.]|nr:hypothetical protein [Pigmentiphaga sp.]